MERPVATKMFSAALKMYWLELNAWWSGPDLEAKSSFLIKSKAPFDVWGCPRLTFLLGEVTKTCKVTTIAVKTQFVQKNSSETYTFHKIKKQVNLKQVALIIFQTELKWHLYFGRIFIGMKSFTKYTFKQLWHFKQIRLKE